MDPFGYGQSYVPSYQSNGQSGGVVSGNPGLGSPGQGGGAGGIGQPPNQNPLMSLFGGMNRSGSAPLGMDAYNNLPANQRPVNPGVPGLQQDYSQGNYNIDPAYLQQGSMMMPGQITSSTGHTDPQLGNFFESNQNNVYSGRGPINYTQFMQQAPQFSGINQPWSDVANAYSRYFNNLNAYNQQYGSQLPGGDFAKYNSMQPGQPGTGNSDYSTLSNMLNTSAQQSSAQSAYNSLYDRYAANGTFGQVGGQ